MFKHDQRLSETRWFNSHYDSPARILGRDPQARKLNLIDQQKENMISRDSRSATRQASVDGDITYGDTSISLDWLKGYLPKIAAVDRSLSDPYKCTYFAEAFLGNQKHDEVKTPTVTVIVPN